MITVNEKKMGSIIVFRHSAKNSATIDFMNDALASQHTNFMDSTPLNLKANGGDCSFGGLTHPPLRKCRQCGTMNRLSLTRHGKPSGDSKIRHDTESVH